MKYDYIHSLLNEAEQRGISLKVGELTEESIALAQYADIQEFFKNAFALDMVTDADKYKELLASTDRFAAARSENGQALGLEALKALVSAGTVKHGESSSLSLTEMAKAYKEMKSGTSEANDGIEDWLGDEFEDDEEDLDELLGGEGVAADLEEDEDEEDLEALLNGGAAETEAEEAVGDTEEAPHKETVAIDTNDIRNRIRDNIKGTMRELTPLISLLSTTLIACVELQGKDGDSAAASHYGVFTPMKTNAGKQAYRVYGLSTGEIKESPANMKADDMKVLNALNVAGCLQFIDDARTNTEELYAGIFENRRWLGMMLACQTGRVKLATGKYGIDAWRKETGSTKGNTTSLTDADSVKQWIKWSLESMCVDKCFDMCGDADVSDYVEAATKVIGFFSQVAFAPVCSCLNMTIYKGDVTGLILGTDTATARNIQQPLQSELARSGGKVTVDIKGNACEMLVALTGEIKEDTKFAGDYVDKFTNAAVNFQHILLGTDRSGRDIWLSDYASDGKDTPMYRARAMYASTRSGKGNMTMNLVATAIASGVMTFYVDCKPETGWTLGEFAWKRGREAYVFNGTVEGQKAPYQGNIMQHTNGRRTETQLYGDWDNVPESVKVMIGSTVGKDTYCGLMVYMKNLELFARITQMRSKEPALKEKWAFWIFDEIQNMSAVEVKVADAFKSWRDKNKSSKENADVAEALKFIKNWQDYMDSFESLIANVITIAFGPSRTSLLFIFQEPTWILQNKDSSVIARFVLKFGDICRKFIGNGGANANACGRYCSAHTKNRRWELERKSINSGEGWWALPELIDAGQDEKTLTNDPAKVFKPYSLWNVPLDDLGNRASTVAEDEKLHYFDYFLDTICNARGVDGAAVIESAFTFADEAVKNHGLADTLYQFIFSYAGLTTAGAGGLMDSLEDKKREGTLDMDTGLAQSSIIGDSSRVISTRPIQNGQASEAQVGTAQVGMGQAVELARQAVEQDNLSEQDKEALGQLLAQMSQRSEFEEMSTRELYTPGTVTAAQPMITADERGAVQFSPELLKALQVFVQSQNNTIVCSYHKPKDKKFAKIMDNPRKFDKYMRKQCIDLYEQIAKAAGGRMGVVYVAFTATSVIVNKKNVRHELLEQGMYEDPVLHLIDYAELLTRFKNIVTLELDAEMNDLFTDQLEPMIAAEDRMNGVASAYDLAFTSNQKLNRIVANGVPINRRESLLNMAKRKADSTEIKKQAAESKAVNDTYTQKADLKKRVGKSLSKESKLGNGLKSNMSKAGRVALKTGKVLSAPIRWMWRLARG